MFKKFNELKNDMSKLKDIQKQLSDVDMTDPKAMLESFGVDYDELEKSFTHTGFEPTQIDYSYKSVNPEPKYHYGSDSGFDLRANEKVILEPFGRALIPTGLHIGLTVLNTPGTIDEGYTGEIKVILINLSTETQIIEFGDKIAQAVISPVIQGRDVKLNRIKVIKDKDRNANGFGSTGN